MIKHHIVERVYLGSQFQRTRVHEGGEGVAAGAAAESLHLELRKGSKKSELGMESLLNSQSPPLVTYFLQKGTSYSYPNITNWGPSSHMPETMGTSHQTSSGRMRLDVRSLLQCQEWKSGFKAGGRWLVGLLTFSEQG